jgi:hypothetical protein
MLKCILQPFRGAKEKGEQKGDGLDDLKSQGVAAAGSSWGTKRVKEGEAPLLYQGKEG